MRQQTPNYVLLTPTEAAAYLAVPRETLKMWRNMGRGPAYVHVGRAVRYCQADLDAFVASGRVEPEHQPDGWQPRIPGSYPASA
jgi:excisionase family DNA binding protein